MQRNKIYKNKKWKEVRELVLKLDHYQCQRCNHNMFSSKEPKRLTKAVLVHHIYSAETFPQYRYSMFVNGKRNLVSLCNDCHEIIHGRKKANNAVQFENEERFD